MFPPVALADLHIYRPLLLCFGIFVYHRSLVFCLSTHATLLYIENSDGTSRLLEQCYALLLSNLGQNLTLSGN
ncbi:hypothetical protein E1A91_D11G018800v1 [Gossypium mustelinum]|uniref:Uncharacterized protein n=4 Tax=Gossypium TaxID=3633 RepID=A0A0D2U9B6_GOSRA|nr:hypothetical protein ES319_D11G018000v1 [Gossypium barbadense]KJB84418.1 hypothetical protein B456_N024100 [Gossypium raimondii]KJB84419.1 hypothetical protein B456_N024100 [Gossypium raimondii]TYH41800.1 hypothetical protein ES332_D11G018600v1 [Gossypium tomentosum]TYI53636.1 hypothetical protein E1A91_D11G018800v1 [Gossypium mustelinum]